MVYFIIIAVCLAVAFGILPIPLPLLGLGILGALVVDRIMK